VTTYPIGFCHPASLAGHDHDTKWELPFPRSRRTWE